MSLDNFKNAIWDIYYHIIKLNGNKIKIETTLPQKNNEKEYISDLFTNLKDINIIKDINPKITSKFITKYNYSYYLNSIDEPPLHLLLLAIISLITPDEYNIIIDFFKNIKFIKNIFKKISINDYKTINNHLNIYQVNNYRYTDLNIFYFIYNNIPTNDIINYTIDFKKFLNEKKKILGFPITYNEKNNSINIDDILKKNIVYIINIIFDLSVSFYKDFSKIPFNNYKVNKSNIKDSMKIIKQIAKHINAKNNTVNLDGLDEFEYDLDDLDDLDDSIINNDNIKILTSFINIYKNNINVVPDTNGLVDIDYSKYTTYINNKVNIDYLIINKDKDIINTFKENHEYERDFNIDNNGFELKEIEYDTIYFNNDVYKLQGLINNKDEYVKMNNTEKSVADADGVVVGVAGDGGGAGVAVAADAVVSIAGGVAGDDDAGDGGSKPADDASSDKNNSIKNDYKNSKLLLYKKEPLSINEADINKQIKDIIEDTKKLLPEKYKGKLNINCKNIKLDWNENSCYIDSLFVALFSAKHKYMDDILYNLEDDINKLKKYSKSIINVIYNEKTYNIITNVNNNIDSNITNIKYNILSIKKELINKYEKISMKKLEDSCNLDKFREYIYDIYRVNNSDNIYEITKNDYKIISKDQIDMNNVTEITDIELKKQIINKYKEKYTNDNYDLIEYIDIIDNIFKNFIFQNTKESIKKIYINVNHLKEKLKTTKINDPNEIIKLLHNNIVDIFDETTTYTYYDIDDIIDTNKYFELITENENKNIINITFIDFKKERDNENNYTYDMTTDDYKLYNCIYYNLFKLNVINDFDDIENTYFINQKLKANLLEKYVLYSTITINNNNNNKSIFIIFDLLDSGVNNYTIFPTEKLYLNNLSNKENKENNENNNKYLSLQSIIFFSKGSIASNSTSEYTTGHYTCLFKCNNKWYYYNDNSSNKITEYEINLSLKDIIEKYFNNLLIRMLYYIAE